MTTDRQRRANALNAKKSTGPKSNAGKKRSSKNAQTHGLTTPPPFEEVLAYYRIILEDAAADPSKADTNMHRAALLLAECEAACDRALVVEKAATADMAIYLKSKGERDATKLFEASKTLDLENPAILELMMMRTERETDEIADKLGPKSEVPEQSKELEGGLGEVAEAAFISGALRILYNSNRHNLARRRRRLERIAEYRRRAEGRRRRAFKSWLRVKLEDGNTKPISILG